MRTTVRTLLLLLLSAIAWCEDAPVNIGLGPPPPSSSDFVGVLPSANGGTGVNNAGTLTVASNVTISGGGTLSLGGFTLTVPATGTAALLGAANAFTGNNTSSGTWQNTNTTTSSSYTTGCEVLSGGLGVAGNIFNNGNVFANGEVRAFGFGNSASTKTATTYAMNVNDHAIIVDATSNNVTITMPAASTYGGGLTPVVWIHRKDTSVNTVTITHANSDTFYGWGSAGASSITIAIPSVTFGGGYSFRSDGSSIWCFQ